MPPAPSAYFIWPTTLNGRESEWIGMEFDDDARGRGKNEHESHENECADGAARGQYSATEGGLKQG